MNVQIDLSQYAKRRSQFSPEQLDKFHREAVLRAAGGLGPRRLEAYPMLTPKEARQHNVSDPVVQLEWILRARHPGPAWQVPEFVDTVVAVLKTRWNESVIADQVASQPAATKRIGNRFAKGELTNG